MTAKHRKLRRDQLDRSLTIPVPPQPQGGWVLAIREALGMTLEALGARLGVTKQTALQIERAVANETITLKRLRRAADALECELVYFLRPKANLDQLTKDRARQIAEVIVRKTGHSMAMEGQAVSEEQLEKTISEVAAELLEARDPRLWQ